MSKIKVIDGIMGLGKTRSMINHINEDRDNNYIFITPFLDECERIKQSCKEKRFITPDETKMGTKKRHFEWLISNDTNIVSTHSLFKGISDDEKELLRLKNYVLVLDEVMDVIEPIRVSKHDMDTILEKYAHVDEDGFLVWDEMGYTGDHMKIKMMALNSSLVYINNTLLVWNFPVEIFKSFKEVYILTYMFKAQIQKYYYDFFNIEYEYLSVKDYKITSELDKDNELKMIKDIKSKINLYDGRLNRIGDKDYSLSKSWFMKSSDIVKLELKKNIFNYFKHNVKTKSKVNAWTTFKDIKKEKRTLTQIQSALKCDGYSRGFIPINMRASNDYKHKESVAYVANRFMNPFVKKMFAYKDIKVSEDLWSLSEMLQLIWRGRIREGNEMNVYIPSKRMRELFTRWLDGEYVDIEKSLLETIYEVFDLDIE